MVGNGRRWHGNCHLEVFVLFPIDTLEVGVSWEEGRGRWWEEGSKFGLATTEQLYGGFSHALNNG